MADEKKPRPPARGPSKEEIAAAGRVAKECAKVVLDLMNKRSAIKWRAVPGLIISPSQCRMGRAALAWSAPDLAKVAEVGVNTVSRFETGANVTTATVEAIATALQAAGVEFTNGDAPGVRLHKR